MAIPIAAADATSATAPRVIRMLLPPPPSDAPLTPVSGAPEGNVLVGDGVAVGVLVGVDVGVLVGVGEWVGVGELVGVAVGVAVALVVYVPLANTVTNTDCTYFTGVLPVPV